MRNAAFCDELCNFLNFRMLLVLLAQEVVHRLDGVER